MSVLARFTPANLTTDKYEEVNRRLESAGAWPPDGLEYHVCFGSEENLRVSEIWDSRDQQSAFAEQLMPVLADVGVEFTGEPEFIEIHNTFKR